MLWTMVVGRLLLRVLREAAPALADEASGVVLVANCASNDIRGCRLSPM